MRDLNRILESRAYHIKLYFSANVMANEPGLQFEQFADGRYVAALGLSDQGLDNSADSGLIDRFQQRRSEPTHPLSVGIALRRLVAPLEPPTTVVVAVSSRW